MATAPIERLKAEIFAKFPRAWSGGDFNCRKIRGSSTWSQHAWGNALDVMVPSLSYGDQINAWVSANRARFGIGTVLWRVKDHYDHLHIEGLPKQRGTPPCAGGQAMTPGEQYASGGFTGGGVAPEGSIIGGAVESVTGGVRGVGDALELLTSGETWTRVAYVVGGALLFLVGIFLMAKELGVSVPIPAGKVIEAVT